MTSKIMATTVCIILNMVLLGVAQPCAASSPFVTGLRRNTATWEVNQVLAQEKATCRTNKLHTQLYRV